MSLREVSAENAYAESLMSQLSPEGRREFVERFLDRLDPEGRDMVMRLYREAFPNAFPVPLPPPQDADLPPQDHDHG